MTLSVPPYLQPPVYVMPEGWQRVAEIAFGLAALGSVLVAAWLSRRRESWQPLIYTVGGGATALNEANLAHLSHATHSQLGAHVAWTAQGVGVPYYALGAYFPYFAIVLLILVPLFTGRRLDARGVWLSALAVVVGVYLFETPWMATGLWHYYGRQSLQPFGWMPVWYACAGAMLTFVPAVVVARVADRLRGPTALLLIPVTVMSSIGAVVAVSWPMYLAMSSTWSDAIVDLAAATSIALVALTVWLAVPLVARGQESVEGSVDGTAQQLGDRAAGHV